MKTKQFKLFPLVVNTEYREVAGVHPLAQRDCLKLCQIFKNEKGFALGIFGSSVSERCNSHSDLDIVIRLFGDESIERFYHYAQIISKANLSMETDVIFYNELKDSELLKREINRDAYPLVYSNDIIWAGGKWVSTANN